MADPRTIDATRADDDAQYDAGLRPKTLDDYIGQDRVRENLQVAIAAARQRGDALDHVLLYGPPGLGKTTLAFVIGNELGVPVRTTSGPVLEKPGDLAGMLTGLGPREVLFIDARKLGRLETRVNRVFDDEDVARIAGVNIPTAKRVEVALTYIHGIGPFQAKKIMEKAKVPLVPGAIGLRPLPKPRATKWAGCLSKVARLIRQSDQKRQSGASPAAPEGRARAGPALE